MLIGWCSRGRQRLERRHYPSQVRLSRLEPFADLGDYGVGCLVGEGRVVELGAALRDLLLRGGAILGQPRPLGCDVVVLKKGRRLIPGTPSVTQKRNGLVALN